MDTTTVVYFESVPSDVVSLRRCARDTSFLTTPR